ncbi:hypothetical protein AAVH_38270, partial [Aphelenchoides avenae]
QECTKILSFFERPRRIYFWEIPADTLVAILRSACASQLKEFSASAPLTGKNAEFDEAHEDAIFYSCFDFTNAEQ